MEMGLLRCSSRLAAFAAALAVSGLPTHDARAKGEAESADSRGAANPQLGTWRLSLKDSIAPQGQTFEEYTVVVRQADESIDFSFTSVGEDGRPREFSFKGRADGTVHEVPGSIKGLKAAMIRLPNGSYESKLWAPDGSYENKFCQVDASLQRNVCLATVTYPSGDVVFFKQVMLRK